MRRCSPRAGLEEDGIVGGKWATEGEPVAGERAIKAGAERLHLHVVAEHPLPRIAIVRCGRQEPQQPMVGERRTKVAAYGQVRGEDREAAAREAVEGVVEHA